MQLNWLASRPCIQGFPSSNPRETYFETNFALIKSFNYSHPIQVKFIRLENVTGMDKKK